MKEEIWSLIRETRSARPGAAAHDDDRAAVYGAALQQFEELMSAAASLNYASRPLPLFYAISQAGRAIAAAWADDPWRLTAHGLKFTFKGSPLRSTVRPDPRKDGSDSFSRIAKVVHSGEVGLTAPVELGALWASLPDLFDVGLTNEPWRRPLEVLREPDDPSTTSLLGNHVVAKVRFDAERKRPETMFTHLHSSADLDEAFEREMRHYPTADGWQHYRHRGSPSVDVHYYGIDFNIFWEAPGTGSGQRELTFTEHAHEHRFTDEWWLRPNLNDQGDFLWPLMTWWGLLFGLSMLARYYPAEWTATLRVDECEETVPLEGALNTALVAVPHFVLQALRAERFTARR